MSFYIRIGEGEEESDIWQLIKEVGRLCLVKKRQPPLPPNMLCHPTPHLSTSQGLWSEFFLSRLPRSSIASTLNWGGAVVYTPKYLISKLPLLNKP